MVACRPCLWFTFLPPSPHPPSQREGGDYKFISPGAPPPAPRALDRLRHLQNLLSKYQAGACPRRHLLSPPRGRGPSQTPPSLATDSSISPGPPSPWLPALPPVNKQKPLVVQVPRPSQLRGCKGRSPLHKKTISLPLPRRGRALCERGRGDILPLRGRGAKSKAKGEGVRSADHKKLSPAGASDARQAQPGEQATQATQAEHCRQAPSGTRHRTP